MLLALILSAPLVFVVQSSSDEYDSRIVQTGQGPVRGYREDDLFIFYNIPYATAPTGVNKFKAPLDGPIWENTFEAVNGSIMCPQRLPGINFNVGQEDCLVATVYVPDTDEKNLPVVVYFHGGAYLVGFGDQWPPRSITRSKRIIAVTFNYRMAIHGFLCLGTEKAPGNAGMKDQVALLRWVNKNIGSFGGNSEDVTIAGYSAGGTSVDLVMLSKSATGLFTKIIPESGAGVALWAVQQDPLETAKEFARNNGFVNVDDISALEEFFTTASWDVLTNLSDYFYRTDASVGFSPCIERDLGDERFLDEAPMNILKQGNYNKVPMLYGFTEMEGLFRVQGGLFDRWKNQMNDRFSDFLPADLEFESDEQKEEVAKEIKEFYFGDQAVSDDTIFEYVHYFTDTMFAYAILRSIKLQVEAGHGNLYLYEYSFVAEERPPALPRLDIHGATHSDQTWAILDAVRDQTTLSDRTQRMQAKVRELWINFIATGTPVPAGSALPAWPPVGAQRAPHMSLNETSQLLGSALQQRAQFWDGIYERYYRMPIAPASATVAYIHSLLLCLLILYIVL